MLNLSAVTLGYNGKAVLQFGGTALAKGESALITGKSGSGKTTLLYALAGLVPVMAGRITVGGIDITALTQAQRDRFRGQHIGMIFQTLHLVRSLTVMENLLLAGYAAGKPVARERAHQLLEELGVAELWDQLPSRISQGQAQRVAIARAVLHRPGLIVADEPTSSLDDEACEAVIALIEQMAREHDATLVIATHDSRLKARFARVVAL
jgi:putative ABC transport system ATP-binding protein